MDFAGFENANCNRLTAVVGPAFFAIFNVAHHQRRVAIAQFCDAAFGAMQLEMNQINAEIDEIIPRFNDLEMDINGGKFIPDANATLRFTFGYIRGYEPEDAVVMSLDYYNSLMETIYLMRSPANAEHLNKSIAQYKAGKVIQRDIFDE